MSRGTLGKFKQVADASSDDEHRGLRLDAQLSLSNRPTKAV
jgi:hypothetical protein